MTSLWNIERCPWHVKQAQHQPYASTATHRHHVMPSHAPWKPAQHNTPTTHTRRRSPVGVNQLASHQQVRRSYLQRCSRSDLQVNQQLIAQFLHLSLGTLPRRILSSQHCGSVVATHTSSHSASHTTRHSATDTRCAHRRFSSDVGWASSQAR